MTVHDEQSLPAQDPVGSPRPAAASAKHAPPSDVQAVRTLQLPEAHFLTFLRNTRYGYVELNATGVIQEVNDRFCDMLERQAEEILGKAFADFVHEADREVILTVLEHVPAHAVTPPRDCRLRGRESRIKTVSFLAGLVSGGTPPQRVICLMEDVNEIRGTQAALRVSEIRLRSLLDHIPDLVLIVSSENRVEHANRETWFQTGVPLWGTLLVEHFAVEDREAVQQSLVAVRATGTPQRFEVRDVQGRWWLSRAVILADGDAAGRIMIICTDVTQRKEGEESLCQSEAELRCLFDNIPDFVILVDSHARIQFVNRPPPGGSTRELLGSSAYAFMDPAYRDACRRVLGLAFASGRAQGIEIRDIYGTWWDCRLVPMPREGRSAGEMMIICANVTVRKQTELSLRKSEARYRALFESTAEAALLFDETTVVDCNEATVRVSGYPSRQALIGEPILKLTASRQLDGADPAAAVAAQMGEVTRNGSARFEWHVRRYDGTVIIMDLTVTLIMIGDEQLFLSLGRDITEQKSFERTLAAMMDQRQQEMAQQLHDELGQDLLGVRLMAEGLKKSLSTRGAAEAQHAGELARVALQAQHRVAQIIKGVRPVEVAPSGLMAALADLALHTERLTDLPCIFQCDRDVPVDNSHTATELFYIAQEAVRNAVKHAAPRRISISLSADQHQLTLAVADDGRGMPPEADAAAGIGLRIMKRRAAVINAALSIRPAQPRGTLVVCTLPLSLRNRK